jgi:hypothetical protein
VIDLDYVQFDFAQFSGFIQRASRRGVFLALSHPVNHACGAANAAIGAAITSRGRITAHPGGARGGIMGDGEPTGLQRVREDDMAMWV